MNVASSLISFTLAATLLTITPGLDTAMILRTSMTQSAKTATKAGLGIIAGCLVWGAAVAVGLGLLITASPLAFGALKWAGAIYLVWFGVQLFRQPRLYLGHTTAVAAGPQRNWIIKGLLQNLLNPKIGVFYVSFLPQFVPPTMPAVSYTFFLAVVHASLTIIWFAILITATRPIARLLQRPGFIKTIDRLTGCVFIAFGARLALAQR
ncbi:MAG TPA: LysE family translocator [Acidocella sp.]|jgi:threonine/homoserine/homoserine lactone efflux protein|nr:MAG: lysine transporter LysE [Acidocella sp. 35-58-6]HQT40352.1 LysE family translocator [Acidocella sp.]